MPDVVIVGAGIIGSAIALELTGRNVRCRILERAVPGAESSSAAAGMLAPHLDAHGPDDLTWRLGTQSLARYAAWIDRVRNLSGADVGYLKEGGIQAILSEPDLEKELASLSWQAERGVRVERLDRSGMEKLLPGIDRKFSCGLFFPEDAQVDPRLLMRALSIATRNAGVEHVTGATVRRIQHERGKITGVELDDRTIGADVVILAAGAWTSTIPGVPLAKNAVEPARGQMVMLDLRRRPFAPSVWYQDGYLVPRSDGRVLLGSTVERVGYDKSVTAGAIHHLLGAAFGLFPSFSAASMIETWAGLRPYCDQPLIGKTEIDGLLVASGHYRNGILLAPITAELMADLV
jgi:glycine oxidase